jgi:histone H3/H4
MNNEQFFSTSAIIRLTHTTGSHITKEAITETKRILEETAKNLITEAQKYTQSSKRTRITETDIKNARSHILKN